MKRLLVILALCAPLSHGEGLRGVIYAKSSNPEMLPDENVRVEWGLVVITLPPDTEGSTTLRFVYHENGNSALLRPPWKSRPSNPTRLRRN